MQKTNTDNEKMPVALWGLALVCIAAIIFSLCGGAAYTAIRQARLSAAKASIGQIEAVLFLAEDNAEKNGYGPAPAIYGNLLKSYDQSSEASLTEYERYVLKAMLESFGTERDFDFAITRFEDSAGIHTQVYFFPYRGHTDMRRSRYYQMTGGQVVEYNS